MLDRMEPRRATGGALLFPRGSQKVIDEARLCGHIMMCMSNRVTRWIATAPGSLMFMGEHGVLHGKRALVCAVDQYMRVTLEPRRDRIVRIVSALGEDQAELGAIEIRAPFRFIWSAVREGDEELSTGFDLIVESEFSSMIGLGSSAAVTVATLAVLDAWRGRALDREMLHQRAWDVIRSVQGRGSGADAAASVFGGMVAYATQPLKIEPLKALHPITVVYSGYKTPTAEVIAKVETERQARPALFDGFFFEVDECVKMAVDAICLDHWAEVGHFMDRNHALMEAIGVNDETLERIAVALREQPEILGAKISGSGLGDCVIGLGRVRDWSQPYPLVPCAMTREGVRIEEV